MHINFLAGIVSLALLTSQAGAQMPTIQVYKTATCGCCKSWIAHLQKNGFTVTSTDVPNVRPISAKNGVPESASSCHTAVVGPYVVEGHVPAEDVRKLLATRPAIRGIAVAGMPAGSPGMESSNPVAYDVVSFDKQGAVKVFSTHSPSAGSR